jgi:hypothetical protein
MRMETAYSRMKKCALLHPMARRRDVDRNKGKEGHHVRRGIVIET